MIIKEIKNEKNKRKLIMYRVPIGEITIECDTLDELVTLLSILIEPESSKKQKQKQTILRSSKKKEHKCIGDGLNPCPEESLLTDGRAKRCKPCQERNRDTSVTSVWDGKSPLTIGVDRKSP